MEFMGTLESNESISVAGAAFTRSTQSLNFTCHVHAPSQYMLRLSRSVLARAAAVATGTASISLCHGHHPSDGGSNDVDAKIEALTERLSMLEAATAKRYGVSQTTGQNGAVFSWDERLTAKFPAECAKHEADLHGGFNEDPATGKVYTGVPGVGLYAISADLETWTRIGSDERLKENIHGFVWF